jgi:recombination protein RecA
MTTKKTPKKTAKKKAAKKTTKKKATKRTSKKSSKKSTSKLGEMKAIVTQALKNEDWKANLDPGMAKRSMPHYPTGSIIIDHLIGGKPNKWGVPPCPGVPKGRILNLYGHEGSGKTTLALTMAAEVIKNGGCVLYIDWEHAIAPEYALELGVPIGDEDRFMLAAPDTLDEGLTLMWVAASKGVELIVLDSVGAGVPKKFYEKSISELGEQGRIGLNAAVWSQFLPKVKGRIAKTGTSIIGISQMRSNINAMGYGEQFTVQGGKSWRYFSALRMKLQRIKTEKSTDYSALTNKSEERVTGAVIKAKLDKCKVSPQQGNEEKFYIRWGEGIDDLRSLIEIAKAHGLVRKSGAWLYWTDPEGEEHGKQGMERFRAMFAEDERYQKVLERQVQPYIASNGSPVLDDDDELDGEDTSAELAEIMGSISNLNEDD